MSKDANSFGHDKALAWESRGFVYTKKRMHRFDTPSCIISMAKREPNHIDGRNRAAYEMCRMLAPMLEDTALPFI